MDLCCVDEIAARITITCFMPFVQKIFQCYILILYFEKMSEAALKHGSTVAGHFFQNFEITINLKLFVMMWVSERDFFSWLY